MSKRNSMQALFYPTHMRHAVRAIALIGAAAVAAAAVVDIRAATAQVTPITPGSSSADFKPMFVKPEDLSDGKRLADTACSGCHGPNGISTTEGVPHIAGQRSVYHYVELKAYQSGSRAASIMGNAVKFLNDDALVKVAAYYAGLEPAQPSAGAAAPRPDPVQAGQAAAASCGGCHGETGVSKTAGMPSLAGLDPKYLVMTMQEYKSGTRKHGVMKALLANVDDSTFSNIALFYGLQNPAKAQTPSPGDQAAGKAGAAACAGCHGDTGVSASAATPSLAGQDAQYLVAALAAYADGSRTDDTMKSLVSGLDADARKNLAAFYASQQPAAPNVRKPLSVSEWAQRCDRCHGLNGNSTDPHMPALAGQRADYLMKVLRDYRSRERRSPEMAAMSDALTDDDIDNLASHYAAQKARSVLYVIVPGR